MNHKANILGDVRAEADTEMLDAAFYETPDYKTLLETSDRTVVVGRRGTGKSALAYILEKHWKKSDKTDVIHLTADEDQIIGMRPIISLFGDSFKLIRAGAKVAWRYAFLMEIAIVLSRRYKFKKSDGADFLETHVGRWRANQYGFCARMKEKLRGVVDSLDEGYEPDQIGIGLLDGLINAIIDLNTRFPQLRTIIFLRDNIFRAISKHDPDFSRNIEGQTLRLHWDEYHLFNLVTKRLKVAFSIKQENTSKNMEPMHCSWPARQRRV